MAAEALQGELRHTVIPQPVSTAPEAAEGFLWAMGEQGDLYRLNPFAASGEQIEVHDRFWAEPQPHAFSLSHRPAEADHPIPAAQETCAVIATGDRIFVSGLFSRARRTLTPSEDERFLVNARDEFQFVAAHAGAVLVLSRHAGQTHLCHFDLKTGEAKRFALAFGETALCGPVLLAEGSSTHAVVWSAKSLWVYNGEQISPVALPEAVELWTAPGESGLRVPLGRSPAIVGSGHLFLPARQFGRPALLRLGRTAAGWSATTIAVLDEGTLSESSSGMPLLATGGKLLACPENAFRTLVQDHQMASQFPAWVHEGLALFFCQADYGGLKEWLKAHAEGTDLPVAWDVPAGARVQACTGFWTMGTALASLCVLGERGLRTEFLSWCV